MNRKQQLWVFFWLFIAAVGFCVLEAGIFALHRRTFEYWLYDFKRLCIGGVVLLIIVLVGIPILWLIKYTYDSLGDKVK